MMTYMTTGDFNLGRLGQLRGTMSAENFQRLVGLFVVDLSDRLAMLDDALRGADRAGIRAAAHAIRGLSGNMGADALSAEAGKMEEMALVAEIPALQAAFDIVLILAMAAQGELDAIRTG
jgi:HPt (histidine-containing phosphotransfer) domain-containing protein